MAFVGIDIAAAVIGLIVLAWFAYRLFKQVKTLGAQVGAAAEKIGEAQRALDQVSANRSTRGSASYTE